MKPSNFRATIGNREFRGVLGILLSILIAIPVLALVGLILFVVFSAVGIVLSITFSVVGVVITIALGIALIAIVIGLLSLLLPKKWREKLGIHINMNRSSKKASKATKTKDGKPIVDVDFKEEK